jgi:hypothetical protein
MVIAIDPGDIKKPYAKAVENFCGIYDDSEHTQTNGYHLCQVTATNLSRHRIVPFYCEAYSSEAKDYAGFTEKILRYHFTGNSMHQEKRYMDNRQIG